MQKNNKKTRSIQTTSNGYFNINDFNQLILVLGTVAKSKGYKVFTKYDNYDLKISIMKRDEEIWKFHVDADPEKDGKFTVQEREIFFQKFFETVFDKFIEKVIE